MSDLWGYAKGLGTLAGILVWCNLVPAWAAALGRRPDPKTSKEPLTASERGHHVLADQDTALVQSTTAAVFVTTTFAIIPLAAWGHPILFSLLFVAWSALLLFTLDRLHWIYERERARAGILQKIDAERQHWDPQGTCPKVVVIHRDAVKESAELFHRVTIASYERGIAVVQYGALA